MQWSKTLRSIWRCIFEKKTRFTRNWDQHDEQKHCVYVRVFLSSMISSIFSWISQYSESNLLLATPLSKNQVHCWSVHLNNQSHWTLYMDTYYINKRSLFWTCCIVSFVNRCTSIGKRIFSTLGTHFGASSMPLLNRISRSVSECFVISTFILDY